MIMDSEKLKLLKSLRLLDQIPEAQLRALGEYLKPLSLQDGAVVFEEGTVGTSLYFISSGQVRISKRVAGGGAKDLAILGPGDCFGEMALVETVARSASAESVGTAVIFELAKDDMNRWLKSHPELAMEFFAELVQTQSKRLRRTSNELALIFDLSNLFLEPISTGQQLLERVLRYVVPHLDGSWSGAAHLYNIFNDEMDLVAGQGGFDFSSLAGKLPPPSETRSLWLGDSAYYVSLPGEKRPHGYLIFRSELPLSEEDRTELGRMLTTVARLLTSALENINFRTEEALRSRLQARTHGARL